VLGKAGLVGAAGAAGYEIGKLINSLGPDGNLGGWIGRKLYDLTHSEYDPNHPAQAKGPISHSIAGKGGSAITVHVHNKIDKNGLATMVTQEQAKSANGPQTGISSFEQTQGLTPAGGGFAF